MYALNPPSAGYIPSLRSQTVASGASPISHIPVLTWEHNSFIHCLTSLLIFHCYYSLHTSNWYISVDLWGNLVVERSATSSLPRWSGQPIMLYCEILMLNFIMLEHSAWFFLQKYADQSTRNSSDVNHSETHNQSQIATSSELEVSSLLFVVRPAQLWV